MVTSALCSVEEVFTMPYAQTCSLMIIIFYMMKSMGLQSHISRY